MLESGRMGTAGSLLGNVVDGRQALLGNFSSPPCLRAVLLSFSKRDLL